MRYNIIATIATKELREVLKSKYILYSLLLMPIMLAILMPLSSFGLMAADPDAYNIEAGDEITLPLGGRWDGYNPTQQMIIFLIEMNNMVFVLLPLILPTVLAADTFSGEKDRGTAEALVLAPISDGEIYMGKILSSVIPTVVAVLIAAILYVFLIDYYTTDLLGFAYLPNVTFMAFIFLLSPMLAFAISNVMIWVSTRTTSTRDAQQLGSLISLPLMAVVVATVGMSALVSEIYLWIAILVLAVVNVFLIKMGISILDRERWVK